MDDAADVKHVVLLGCGRSGTSIFGELFDTLDGYTYYSEPPFSDVMGYDFTDPVAVKVPRESADFAPTPGLSFPLSTLQRVVANRLHLFWIVRHPLDAICSLRPGIANDWGHHPQPPDWKQWLPRPLIEQCAHHWDYINSLGFEQIRNVATVVHFEDMIAEPAEFARGVCAELGINGGSQRANLQTWSDRVQDSNNSAFIEAECSRNYSRPDHRVRVGRWKENLSASEVDAASNLVRETAATFGYIV